MPGRPALLLLLLWLVGINLRTPLLSVPPVLPELHERLGLSHGAAGLLTTLPLLVMALGGMLGALAVTRLTARRAVGVGLALVTAGTVLRGALPSNRTLFAFTLLLALGIAVSQPALPSLVQAWFPSHLGRATAVFSNGLLAGEVLAATITLPLLLDGLRLGWQGSLAAWALPAGVTLILWMALTTGGPSAVGLRPARWLPDLGSGNAWRVALLMAGASVVYFGMNTWIPDTLAARRESGLIPAALGLLNFMQIPVSLALTVAGDRLIGRRWPYVAAGLGCSLGIAGFAWGPVAASPGFAGLIGAGSSLVFVLNLALPALLAPAEVARVSGFMFMVGYGCAFLVPAAGGLAWDRTGDPLAALLPIAVSAVVIVGLGLTLPRLSRSASPSIYPEPSPPA